LWEPRMKTQTARRNGMRKGKGKEVEGRSNRRIGFFSISYNLLTTCYESYDITTINFFACYSKCCNKQLGNSIFITYIGTRLCCNISTVLE
jgi:hypothetical protein